MNWHSKRTIFVNAEPPEHAFWWWICTIERLVDLLLVNLCGADYFPFSPIHFIAIFTCRFVSGNQFAKWTIHVSESNKCVRSESMFGRRIQSATACVVRIDQRCIRHIQQCDFFADDRTQRSSGWRRGHGEKWNGCDGIVATVQICGRLGLSLRKHIHAKWWNCGKYLRNKSHQWIRWTNVTAYDFIHNGRRLRRTSRLSSECGGTSWAILLHWRRLHASRSR